MKSPSTKHKVISSCAEVITATQNLKLYKDSPKFLTNSLVVADLLIEINTLKLVLIEFETELTTLLTLEK